MIKRKNSQQTAPITAPASLLHALQLPENLSGTFQPTAAEFPLRVNAAFLQRIHPANPDDPLLRQVLPLTDERQPDPNYCDDAVGDLAASPSPGLIHKYHGRVLLLLTNSCPIHCRFCFRRNFPYRDHQLSHRHLQQALDYITAHHEISEVVLSGGDPLMVSNQRLFEVIAALGKIPHLTTLRIHSRVPVVMPQRIDPELLNHLRELAHTPLQPVLVIHCNHPQELGSAALTAIHQLKESGVVLLNQSVLLRGVNDSLTTLKTLSHTLFRNGVLPYYLHRLDHARGVSHFAVNPEKEAALVKSLQSQLPGYLMPKVVQDVAGTPYKAPYYQP
ncbi:MAG: EF-P beta-lysylation protein EpmB [Gammaproteobacteria bacterium]|nr:EF-P beta-lysylation protein EpmB [Gammaproteobacteria bacterium]